MSAVAASWRCAQHEDRPAVAACQRCGRRVCEEDRHVRDGIIHCAGCLSADPAEAFRGRLWGRRDVWAWVMGLSALPQLWVTVEAVRQRQGVAWTVASAALTVLCVCYFLGQRWTRWAVLLTPPLVLLVPESLFTAGAPEGMDLSGTVLATRLTVLVVGYGVLVAMLFDLRNRLFFRIEPTRDALLRARSDYLANRIAYWALGLAAMGILLPGIGPVALPMAITALYRVYTHRPERLPGAKAAWAATALGVLGLGWFLLVRSKLEQLTDRLSRGEPLF